MPQLWHRAPPIQLNSYQQVLMTHCPDEGCLAHDADGTNLLCLMSHKAQHLVATQLSPPGHGDGDGKRSWSLSGVVSAAAVAATRQYALGMHDCMPPHDLLILHSSGRLALHIGQRMICYVAAKLEEPPAHEDVVGAANLALLHGGTVSSEVSTDQLNWRVGHLCEFTTIEQPLQAVNLLYQLALCHLLNMHAISDTAQIRTSSTCAHRCPRT